MGKYLLAATYRTTIVRSALVHPSESSLSLSLSLFPSNLSLLVPRPSVHILRIDFRCLRSLYRSHLGLRRFLALLRPLFYFGVLLLPTSALPCAPRPPGLSVTGQRCCWICNACGVRGALVSLLTLLFPLSLPEALPNILSCVSSFPRTCSSVPPCRPLAVG